MSNYKSKHTGAQVDEAVSKVLNGEVGGGADWNAQEGEAGYIENRTHANVIETKTITTGGYTLEDGKLTFGHIFNGGDVIRIDRDLIDSGSNNLNNNIKIHGVDHYQSDINEHFFYYVKDIINPSKDKKYPIYFDIDYDNIVGYIKIYEYESEYYLSIITNADQNDTFRVNYEIFKPLDINYLPNTVLKTTPQTLSNTDKNQALTNLGIDPVVWKYMCEPYIIEPESYLPGYLYQLLVNNNPLILNLCKIKVEVDVYDDIADAIRPIVHFCTPIAYKYNDEPDRALSLQCITFYDNTYHTYYVEIDESDGQIYDITEIVTNENNS